MAVVSRGILRGLGMLTRSTGCSMSYTSDKASQGGGDNKVKDTTK